MIGQEDKYRTIINKEQKKIIGTVDKAILAKLQEENPKELKKVLSNLIRDTIRQFEAEETNMKNYKYPEYQYHKEEHQNFSAKTLAYRKTILNSDSKTANEILDYLKNCLVKHFQEADKKSTEYCNKSTLK